MGYSQLGQRPFRHLCGAAGLPRALAGAIAALAFTLLMSGLAPAPALANPGCAKFAAEPSKGGSDENAGDEAHPYATLGKLVASLSAGQTGCILSGQTIDVNTPQVLRNDSRGTEAAPITITSTNPAEPATVSSWLALEEGADWINFTHLRFWWAQPPPYTCWNSEGNATGAACNGEQENTEDHVQIAISSSHTSWLYDDIQNFDTDICLNIVSYDGSTAYETLIEHDRIHNCGLPFKGEKHVNEESAWHDHAIYDYGVGTKIFNSYIYGNSRNGILFYGGGHGGVAEHNVIDENGNGITFGTTTGSTARWNIITNNALDDTGDCAPKGCDDFGAAVYEAAGDRFEHNCLDGNLSGEIEDFLAEPVSLLGVIVGGNLLNTNPLYANAANHEYTLSPSSPCLGYGPDTAQPHASPPINLQPPTVLVASPSSLPTVGLPVTALVGSWSGATSYSFQWNACMGSSCAPIPGATGPAYAPTAANVQGTLTVTVTATNANGSASATSPETWTVIFEELLSRRPAGVFTGSGPAFAVQGASGGLVLTSLGSDGEGLLSVLLGSGALTTSNAPSAAVGPGGDVWIAFEGPGHTLWITAEPPGSDRPVVVYQSPEGTTYSAPSITIGPRGQIWVAAVGPERELVVTQRAAESDAWSSSATTEPGMVFSSPSAVVDPSGNVWIAFQAQDRALRVQTDWLGGGGWWSDNIGQPGIAYSEPSIAADAAGDIWLAAKGPQNSLLLGERVANAYSWHPLKDVLEGAVHSAPSAVVSSAGNVAIAFKGPGDSLFAADASPAEASSPAISYAGPEGVVSSPPSAVAGPHGELWLGYQQPSGELGVLEQLPSGTWTAVPGG